MILESVAKLCAVSGYADSNTAECLTCDSEAEVRRVEIRPIDAGIAVAGIEFGGGGGRQTTVNVDVVALHLLHDRVPDLSLSHPERDGRGHAIRRWGLDRKSTRLNSS